MTTKKILTALALGLSIASFTGGASAAGGPGIELQKANIDPTNQGSLQRGAQLFVNYCLGCHSLAFQRYSRVAADLGMTDQLVADNLMFTADKIGEPMRNAMPARNSKEWFGQVPPDLSVMSREKGVDYLYTYLKTFYLDPEAPVGTNNQVLPNASMPWSMWELQGFQKPVWSEVDDGHGNVSKKIAGFEQVTEGTMTPEEFDGAIRDLVNFLAYVGEPIKQYRQQLGIRVILFLLLLTFLAYMLKREYWKDVH